MSGLQKKRRKYPGQDVGEKLALYLNKENSADADRIREVFDFLYRDFVYARDSREWPFPFPPRKASSEEEFTRATEEYDDKRHQMLKEGFSFHINPLLTMKRRRVDFVFVFFASDLHYKDQLKSGRILRYILHLGQNGLLDRVRPCEQCKKWFYAKTPWGKYCDKGCGDKYLRATEAGKEKRRKYMATHRAQPAQILDSEGRKGTKKRRRKR